MSDYKCNKCKDVGYCVTGNTAGSFGYVCECMHPKKSEWLKFDGVTIRKSIIASYHLCDNQISIELFCNSFTRWENFKTEQEAQARFDEIDRDIRL